MRWNGFLLITLAASLVAAPASASTFQVTSTVDTGVGVGCEGDSCPSIRAAIVSAAGTPGADTINVQEGDYHLSSGELYVDTPVEIVGAGARKTVVYGNTDAFRVLEVAPGSSASISAMTLRDGLANANGGTFLAGGVIRNSGTLTLDRVRITGGHASSGGGIANTSGTVTITRSLIDNNASTIGGGDSGGILNFDGGTVTVRDSTIASNVARGGGAYFSWGDSGTPPNVATFERVTVTGNRATFGGPGGLSHAAADTLRLKATIIAGNTLNGVASNCSGSMTSDGANLEDGTDCGLTGPGDRQQNRGRDRPFQAAPRTDPSERC